MHRGNAVLLTLTLLLSLTATARSAEVLKLKNGELVAGDVIALDDESVEFARSAGGSLKVRWTQVLPVSRYELWESTLAADDAVGRVKLARWALGEKLYVYARKELLRARGLGYEPLEELDATLAGVDRAEADAALADVDEFTKNGEPQKALDRVRTYLRVAPPGEHADRVRERVPDLLARIERNEALAEDEAKEKLSEAEQRRRDKWISGNIEKAVKLKGDATEHAIEAYAYLAKGNQTRSRRALAKAEKGFQGARALYKRVRRVVGSGDVAEQCQTEMADCDRRTVDLLTKWGRLETDNRSYKKASAIVDRGLAIDPVDRELLDLRAQIDENWIRRKLSGITNASGRESN